MEQIEGTVFAGVGEGAYFVGLAWVQDEIRRIVGFDPYAGTLNLRIVDGHGLARWRQTRKRAGIALTPPDPETCGGRLLPVVVAGHVPAAVVIPDVTRYEDDIVEVIAPARLRTLLALHDGDRVRLTFEAAP